MKINLKLMKKGEFTLDQLGKLILALVLLLFLILAIYFFKDKMYDILEKFRSIVGG